MGLAIAVEDFLHRQQILNGGIHGANNVGGGRTVHNRVVRGPRNRTLVMQRAGRIGMSHPARGGVVACPVAAFVAQ